MKWDFSREDDFYDYLDKAKKQNDERCTQLDEFSKSFLNNNLDPYCGISGPVTYNTVGYSDQVKCVDDYIKKALEKCKIINDNIKKFKIHASGHLNMVRNREEINNKIIEEANVYETKEIEHNGKKFQIDPYDNSIYHNGHLVKYDREKGGYILDDGTKIVFDGEGNVYVDGDIVYNLLITDQDNNNMGAKSDKAYDEAYNESNVSNYSSNSSEDSNVGVENVSNGVTPIIGSVISEEKGNESFGSEATNVNNDSSAGSTVNSHNNQNQGSGTSNVGNDIKNPGSSNSKAGNNNNGTNSVNGTNENNQSIGKSDSHVSEIISDKINNTENDSKVIIPESDTNGPKGDSTNTTKPDEMTIEQAKDSQTISDKTEEISGPQEGGATPSTQPGGGTGNITNNETNQENSNEIGSGTEEINNQDSENNETDNNQESEYDEQEYDEQEYDEQEYDEQEYDEQEYDEQEYDEQEYDEQEYDEQEYDEQEYNEPEYNEPEYNEPEYNEPEYNEPEYNEPEYNEPEYNETELNEPEDYEVNPLEGFGNDNMDE